MTYVYKNAETGEVIEQDYRIGQAPDSVELNGCIYKRVYTAPGISFVGSGWACKS